MRIAIAGLCHETNTFAEGLTTLEDFERPGGFPGLLRGPALIEALRGAALCTGGFLAAAETHPEVTLVPLIWTFPQPSGLVAQAAFEAVCDLLLARLREALPVDGVLLDLHGAMVTEQFEDAEGELLRRVREIVGPDLPVIATLDLHANISPAMVARATALVGYDTYPHVDARERGEEACELIRRAVTGESKPTAALAQIPMLIGPPRQCTLLSPMADVIALVHEAEKRPGVLSITLSGGFPFADTHATGASVVVVTEADPGLAEALARELAGEVWARREEFRVTLTPVEEAIAWARANGGPVVLADGSDNPGGGAPCDGTVMLEALIESGVSGAVVAVIADPQAVEQAIAAGVGHDVTLRVGGKTDSRHGAPLTLTGHVRVIADGNHRNRGPMFNGLPVAMGRTVVLVVGGVEIVLTERRMQPYDAEALRSVGIDPTDRLLIGLKSAVHFRADYQPFARRIFEVATPGIHDPDVTKYDYQRLRHPMWPVENGGNVRKRRER